MNSTTPGSIGGPVQSDFHSLKINWGADKTGAQIDFAKQRRGFADPRDILFHCRVEGVELLAERHRHGILQLCPADLGVFDSGVGGLTGQGRVLGQDLDPLDRFGGNVLDLAKALARLAALGYPKAIYETARGRAARRRGFTMLATIARKT